MSNSERTLELIQLALDGEASEEESAELGQILANSGEAREAYRALRELVEKLEAVPSSDPPPMREAILERIRNSTSVAQALLPVQAQTRVSVPHRRRLLLAAVYAVAAAIVIGVALNRLIERREHAVSPTHAAAAMARLDDIDNWPIVARVSSRGAMEKMTLTVRRQGDRYAIQPILAGPGAVSVAWDRQKLALLEVLPGGVQSDADEVTFADRSKQVAVVLRRRDGASGSAVVRMIIAGKEGLRATINF